MAPSTSFQTSRRLYACLLRWYPKPFRQRFGESMQQTFADLLTDRAATGKPMLPWLLWLFVETAWGIFHEKVREMNMKIKDVLFIVGPPALLLSMPLVAMQFSEEVAWSPADFAIAGLLLSVTSFAIWFTLKSTSNLAYRIAMGVAALSGLLLIWMNLAVGLIGNEENPANLMYLAVLAVGIAGAGLARFKAKGMAGTLLVAALLQALIAAITLLTGLHLEAGEPVVKVLFLNCIFIGLFCLSALLFRHASQQPTKHLPTG